MKVYVVGYATGYARFISDLELVNKIEDADVVLFTGGCDVDPSTYGKKRHHSVYSDLRRDKQEIEAFKKMRKDQLAYGTCRGFQLLGVLNGANLVQDCDNHCGSRHQITNGEETYTINSIHHQMVYPYDLPEKDYTVLFKSHGVGNYYEGDGIDPNVIMEKGEPEIAVFHREDMPICLGVQGHPEMMPDSPVAKMIDKLIHEYVAEKCHNRG